MRISTSTGRSCRNAVKLFCGQIKRTQVTKHVGCTEALHSWQRRRSRGFEANRVRPQQKGTLVTGDSDVKLAAAEVLNGAGVGRSFTGSGFERRPVSNGGIAG